MRATPIKEHSKAACTLELKKFLQVAPFPSDSTMLICLALQNPGKLYAGSNTGLWQHQSGSMQVPRAGA